MAMPPMDVLPGEYGDDHKSDNAGLLHFKKWQFTHSYKSIKYSVLLIKSSRDSISFMPPEPDGGADGTDRLPCDPARSRLEWKGQGICMKAISLRVDVDTLEGSLTGIPTLLRLLD